MSDRRFLICDMKTGERYVLTNEQAKQKLGICRLKSQINTLSASFNDLQEMLLEKLLIPEQKEAIIKFLSQHPKGVKTSIIKRWEHNAYDKAWNIALERLVDEDKVTSVSHGRGRQRTWHLNKEDS